MSIFSNENAPANQRTKLIVVGLALVVGLVLVAMQLFKKDDPAGTFVAEKEPAPAPVIPPSARPVGIQMNPSVVK